jgi:hypothetical protein
MFQAATANLSYHLQERSALAFIGFGGRGKTYAELSPKFRDLEV